MENNDLLEMVRSKAQAKPAKVPEGWDGLRKVMMRKLVLKFKRYLTTKILLS